MSTAHPRPNRTICGARREQRGRVNASSGGGKRRGYSRRNRRNRRRRRDQGKKRRREAMENRADTRRHLWRAKGRQGTIRVTPLPQRTYVSGRSTETGSTSTMAPTLMEAPATTRHGRRGGVTLRSCHRGAMTRQVGELGGGSSGRLEHILRGGGTDCGTRSGSSSFRR